MKPDKDLTIYATKYCSKRNPTVRPGKAGPNQVSEPILNNDYTPETNLKYMFIFK